jgi:hypothetical protein
MLWERLACSDISTFVSDSMTTLFVACRCIQKFIGMSEGLEYQTYLLGACLLAVIEVSEYSMPIINY